MANSSIEPEPDLVNRLAASLSRYSLPPMILLDITNVCNLKCIHCPQPSIQYAPGFKARHLSMDHFLELISELAESDEPRLIRFVGDGEPMLHPQLVRMVEVAKQRTRCVVNLTTNGTRLDPSTALRLLEAGIDVLDISLDALTKPVYSRVRVGGRFERVLANLFNLLEMRKRMALKTKVFVSLVKQSENEAEVDGFLAFWRPLVDAVLIRNLHSANHRVKSAESTARNGAYTLSRFPCPHPFKRLIIDFAGRVKFCPTDWGTGSQVGVIGESSLREIWNRLQDLREQHLAGCISAGSICAPCTDWASSPWAQGYERLIDTHVFGQPILSPELPLLDEAREA